MVKKLQGFGLYVATSTPEELRDLVEKHLVRMARLLKEAGVEAK